MKHFKFLGTAVIAGALVLVPLAATPAVASEGQEPYVIAAWSATEGDIWNPAQTLAEYRYTYQASLDTLDALLPCGGYYQVDLYWNDEDTAALLAGGVLYGPQNPTEPHAYVVEGDPWKLMGTAPCAEMPEPRTFSDEGEVFSCEAWTRWAKTGFYELTLDRVANVWVEAAEPTVTTETSEQVPTTEAERVAGGCVTGAVSELAETGLDSGASWLLIVALMAIVGGGAMFAYRAGKEEQ